MNELLNISKTPIGEAVNSRELYLALGYDVTHYAKWCRKNIEDNGFAIEGRDWASVNSLNPASDGFLALSASNKSRGRFAKEHALSTDFAERLAMMARTEKGEQVRLFFQSCRDRLKQMIAQPVAETPEALMARALLVAEQTLAEKDKKIQQLTPYATHAARILESSDVKAISIIAKERGVSAKALNSFLNAHGIQYMVGGVWVLYAKYQAKGYSRIVTREYVDGDGKLRTSNEMRWTERGAAFIHWLCDKEGFGVNQGQQIASGMFGSP